MTRAEKIEKAARAVVDSERSSWSPVGWAYDVDHAKVLALRDALALPEDEAPKFPRAPMDSQEEWAARVPSDSWCRDRHARANGSGYWECTVLRRHDGDHVAATADGMIVARWPQSPQRWGLKWKRPGLGWWTWHDPATNKACDMTFTSKAAALMRLERLSCSDQLDAAPYPSPPPNTPAAAKGEREVVGWRVKARTGVYTRVPGDAIGKHAVTKVRRLAFLFPDEAAALDELRFWGRLACARPIPVTRKRRGGR